MKHFIILIPMLFTLVGCLSKRGKEARAFEEILQDQTGQAHSAVKYPDGYVVYRNEVTGEYSAYNLDKFDRKEMKTYSAYLAVADSDDIVGNLVKQDEYIEIPAMPETPEESLPPGYFCDARGVCHAWVSFYVGGGYKFENNSTPSHDLETMAAMNEDATLALVSSQISSDYSLSSARADEMARLALRFQRLENKRELTASEKNVFALEALGVSYAKVEASMKDFASGNEKSYQELLETAAKKNRTTPESIGKFFEDFIAE